VSDDELRALVDPAHTVLVTQECQEGVLGEAAVFPTLAEAAATSVVPNGAALCTAARAAGVPVVHCLALHRADGTMERDNAPLYRIAARSGVDLRQGTPGAEVIAAFGPVEADTVVGRFGGIGPMHGTDLDATLRDLGCTTVVAIGVSLNVGLTNLVMDAVNAGYDVVVPRDAVAGVPVDYAQAMLANTIAMLATLTTTADVVAAWS
jgi:nicotinamidase-related amidase